MDGDQLIIGTREVWGHPLLFGLSREDRRQHLYIIGQTGTGKSTLLCELIRQDIERGEGCALLDPHGDLANSVLDTIPSWRTDDVVLIEPADLAHPIAINPFFRVPADDRPLVASNLVAAFKHLWRDSWGPRLEYLLYNAIAALLDCPDHLRPTLLSVPRLFVDVRYRDAVVAAVSDPQVRQFWTGEFSQWGERFLSEATAPLQNKIGAIVSAPSLRNILGQWRPTVELSAIMEDGKILVANLAKGEIGEDKANMIGSLLVASFQAASMKRSKIPEAERRDFHLYLDEFHNFGTDSFASILSESRKMRLSLTLAHQFIAQVPEHIRDAVFGNVGSIVSFRVGAEDATQIARELSEYSPATLRGLERGKVCVRLIQSGEVGQPFLGETHVPCDSHKSTAATMRTQSRQRYAHSRSGVEEKIRRWLYGLSK